MARSRSRGVAKEAMAIDKAQVLNFIGLEFVRVIKETLSRPGTGRVYRRGKKQHQASAPGEPPARDRGILVGSIGMDVQGEVLIVGTGEQKAVWLEFGTTHEKGGTMEARPFMRPSLKELQKLLPTLIGSEVRRARRG